MMTLEDESSTTVLSRKVGSTPVIMVFLNVQKQDWHLIPRWVKLVDEFPSREDLLPGDPRPTTGIKICEGKRNNINTAIVDAVRSGYVPVRFLAIKRSQGVSRRMVLVLVHERYLGKGERRLTDWQKADIKKLTMDHAWDSRVHRNPGPSGGNFIIEAGNPKRGDKTVSELVINDASEFELVAVDSELAAQTRAPAVLDMALDERHRELRTRAINILLQF